MKFIIFDSARKEYFLSKAAKSGWYGTDADYARIYKTMQAAQRVIDDAGHHVSYPNRLQHLIVLPKP